MDYLFATRPRYTPKLRTRVPKVLEKGLEHGLDLHLFMQSVLAVPAAVLAQFELGLGVAPVLL